MLADERFVGLNLKLLSDIAKYEFVKTLIKGSVAVTCKGYAEANNRFLNLCDGNKPTSYFISLGGTL